jgi:hypothetical protein
MPTASAERAKALLGWQLARSELAVQIADTWNWMKMWAE